MMPQPCLSAGKQGYALRPTSSQIVNVRKISQSSYQQFARATYKMIEELKTLLHEAAKEFAKMYGPDEEDVKIDDVQIEAFWNSSIKIMLDRDNLPSISDVENGHRHLLQFIKKMKHERVEVYFEDSGFTEEPKLIDEILERMYVLRKELAKILYNNEAASRLLSSTEMYESETNIDPFSVADHFVLEDDPDEDYWRGEEGKDAEEKRVYMHDPVRKVITSQIESLLPEGGYILDVMCGIRSCIFKKPGRRIYGIGLVPEALEMNKALDAHQVLNINEKPDIDSYIETDEKFDAAVISLGMPYMKQPLEVLRAIHRLLKPGGKIIILCSINHFDRAKAMNIWFHPDFFDINDDLIGLVMDYLRDSESFKPKIFLDLDAVDELLDKVYTELEARPDYEDSEERFGGFIVYGEKINRRTNNISVHEQISSAA